MSAPSTEEVIGHVRAAIHQARITRQAMIDLCALVEYRPDLYAHSAELYGVISELRETLRPTTMRVAEAQKRLYAESPLGKALNVAHFEGAERARVSGLKESTPA